MTEVETRLSQLREAADQINRACLRIDQCIEDVRLTLDALLAAGWRNEQAAYFVQRYRYYSMGNWPDVVRKLAGDLNRAADDIESAVSNPPPVSVTVYHGGGGYHGSGSRLRTVEAAPLPLPYTLADYVSPVNRGLYDTLTRDQQKFDSEQIRLDALLQSRAHLAEDLTALKNRLLSYNPNLKVNAVPRVQAMQTQLDQFDQQITQSREDIQHWQSVIADLSTRLERVKPGAGADLKLIEQLTHSPTAQWVKDHTEGCVNYIASRMPIPDGIAQDAYLWDDKAAQLTQYGITSGNVPLAGSVIVLEREHSYADDVFGHLLYVERVDSGGVWVTDNYHATAVNLTAITHEVSGPNIHYLYFPWWTEG